MTLLVVQTVCTTECTIYCSKKSQFVVGRCIRPILNPHQSGCQNQSDQSLVKLNFDHFDFDIEAKAYKVVSFTPFSFQLSF